MTAIPPRAEPLRYVRAWCCYRLLMALPMRWAWCRKMAIAVAPHAGDWAYRYAPDGDTAPRSRGG
jgi:hypothetical protein